MSRRIRGVALAAVALASALGVAACQQPQQTELAGTTSSAVTARDWLEGAYIKEGGRVLHAVFRRPDEGSNQPGTFFGEVEDNGVMRRAEGTFSVTRDKLGTVVILKL